MSHSLDDSGIPLTFSAGVPAGSIPLSNPKHSKINKADFQNLQPRSEARSSERLFCSDDVKSVLIILWKSAVILAVTSSGDQRNISF